MTFKSVDSKSDFVSRYSNGEFGNASPTWQNIDSFTADTTVDRNALFHIRNRVAGGDTFYNLGYSSTIEKWSDLLTEKRAGSFYISQMCPTEKTILQGEVMQAFPGSECYGLQLHYTTVAKPMREALKERSEGCHGLRALAILRLAMDNRSYEWLNVLLDRYPYHVIEFTSFSVKWGTIPGWNTVFWEVRNY